MSVHPPRRSLLQSCGKQWDNDHFGPMNDKRNTDYCCWNGQYNHKGQCAEPLLPCKVDKKIVSLWLWSFKHQHRTKLKSFVSAYCGLTRYRTTALDDVHNNRWCLCFWKNSYSQMASPCACRKHPPRIEAALCVPHNCFVFTPPLPLCCPWESWGSFCRSPRGRSQRLLSAVCSRSQTNVASSLLVLHLCVIFKFSVSVGSVARYSGETVALNNILHLMISATLKGEVCPSTLFTVLPFCHPSYYNNNHKHT